MKIHESYLARRRFLGTMVGGGAAALGAGMAAPLASYVGNLREEPPPDFIELGPEEYDLPPGKGKLVKYGRGGDLVLLFRTPEPQAELRAFVGICTHLTCKVGYKEDENCIFCGCHYGYFDLEGRPTAGPPQRPLDPVYFAKRDDGKLILALKEENLAKAFEQEP
jgi:Rieske Fe-S protein